MSRIAMITPFPPTRDGIATYAVQELIGLRAQGHDVEVFSPLPSAAHHHVSLGRAKGWIGLVRMLNGFDRAVVQLYPDLVHGQVSSRNQRAACWMAVAALTRKVPTELRIHELAYDPLRRNEIERKAFVAAASRADVITVHTESEREKLVAASGISKDSVHLVEHGQYFVRHIVMTREQARQELGLDQDKHIFLSIGFLQSHKGFDRAVTAFKTAQCVNAELHIVGSVRVDAPDLLAYANRLERSVDPNEGTFLHRKFVADPEFDLWLTAADTVVLPYREIWSSSVVERAKLFERQIVVTNIGGLAAQVGPGDHIVTNDDELALVFAEIAGSVGTPSKSRIDVSGADELQQLIRDRSELNSGGAPRPKRKPATYQRTRLDQPLEAARPVSGRTGVSAAKSLIQRVTGWQVDPIIERLNDLQRSNTAAMCRLEDLEADQADTRIQESDTND